MFLLIEYLFKVKNHILKNMYTYMYKKIYTPVYIYIQMTSCGFLHLPSHMVTPEPIIFPLLLKHADGNVLKESLALPILRYLPSSSLLIQLDLEHRK